MFRSKFQTSVPAKLYDSFQKQVKDALNVTEVMSGWVTQPGYPVIYANISSDRKTIELTQRRFLRNKVEHDDKTQWSVPITFASDKQNANFNNTKAGIFLSGETLQINVTEPIEWIVFNVQQTGTFNFNLNNHFEIRLPKKFY